MDDQGHGFLVSFTNVTHLNSIVVSSPPSLRLYFCTFCFFLGAKESESRDEDGVGKA